MPHRILIVLGVEALLEVYREQESLLVHFVGTFLCHLAAPTNCSEASARPSITAFNKCESRPLAVASAVEVKESTSLKAHSV